MIDSVRLDRAGSSEWTAPRMRQEYNDECGVLIGIEYGCIYDSFVAGSELKLQPRVQSINLL